MNGKAHRPTYTSWQMMLQRCTNKKLKTWPRYGGRGIRVCDRWRVFANFLADMGERPPGTTIDRYPDNNGNYEPGNCRWATPAEQGHSRPKTHKSKPKRGPGRPKLGAEARSIVVPVRLTKAQYKALEEKVKRENAEINADPLATAEDKKPATVSSWIRDVIEESIPSASRRCLHDPSS